MPAEPQIITQKREMPLKQSKGSQFVSLFLQNKPNLPNAQISVNSFLTRNYEDFQPYSRRQNKPNQTQYQTQSKPIKAQKTRFQTQTNPNKPNIKPKNSKKNGFRIEYGMTTIPAKPDWKPLDFLELYLVLFGHFFP